METIASSVAAALSIISLSAAPVAVLLVAIIAARIDRHHNREGLSLISLLREMVFLAVAVAASAFLGSLAFSNLESLFPKNFSVFYPVQSILYGALYAIFRPLLNHVFREVEAMNDIMAGLQNDLTISLQENTRLHKLIAALSPESESATMPGGLAVMPSATAHDRMATAA